MENLLGAREQIKGNEQDNVIINRDSLRKMFHDSYWFRDRSMRNISESFIHKASFVLAELAFKEHKNMYIDETNLSDKSYRQWEKFSAEKNITMEVKDFRDVPLKVCLDRDAARDRSVGESVIREKYNRFIKPMLSGNDLLQSAPSTDLVPYDPYLEDAVVCDVDGTVAKIDHRSPYDVSDCQNDYVHEDIVALLNIFVEKGYKILFVSGRDGGLARDKTVEWAEKNNIPFDGLFMRPAGDNRRDDDIKTEIYHKYLEGNYNILYVLDDRNRTVDAWRSLGLRTLQVASGDF